jgi:hypothetical protein
MSVVAPDGSLYVAHSPLRRAVGKAIYPDLTPKITGGIARFKPVRLDLLARDAVCAAEARSANTSQLDKVTELTAIKTDIRQIQVLMTQANGAVETAVNQGDMSRETASTLRSMLNQITATPLTTETLAAAHAQLVNACGLLDSTPQQ